MYGFISIIDLIELSAAARVSENESALLPARYHLFVKSLEGMFVQYMPSKKVLEEIVQAVKGKMKVFVDGGIRNGVDVFKALAMGADGVIICGCHPGDCHYTSGNYYTRRRMAALFSMLDYLGIEKERTRVEWVSAAEGAKFAATMNDFVKKVAALGENKRLEDLRCKK